MKKVTAAGVFLLAFGIAQTVYGAGQTTVSYHVDPSYLVRIPQDTSITFNEESDSFGKITIEEAHLDEGKGIQVRLISDKKLKNQNGGEGIIPYDILADGKSFTEKIYTLAGEETALTTHIDSEAWKKAPAGSYADTVVFEISCVDVAE